jgi:hypothetical protein
MPFAIGIAGLAMLFLGIVKVKQRIRKPLAVAQYFHKQAEENVLIREKRKDRGNTPYSRKG